MIEPYCTGQNDWDCIRGVMLSLLSIATTIACMYCLGKIIRVWVSTRWYSLNIFMILMGLMQTLLESIHYTFMRDSRMSVSVKFLRSLQSTITLYLYGRLALQSKQRDDLISKVLLPAAIGYVIYNVIIFASVMTSERVDCFHPTWLIMSVSNLVSAIPFTISGCIVMRELGLAASLKVRYSTLLEGDQAALVQRRHQVTVLLTANTVGAIFQLALDIYQRFMFEAQQDCIVLTKDDAAGAQLLQILLQLLSTLLPVWVLLYVFYWVPRHQYDTNLDVDLPESEFELLAADDGDIW